MAGGITGGKKLKAVIPGGSSCPLLTADEIDIPHGLRRVAKAGSMLGLGRHGGDGRRHLHGGSWRGASCISTRTNPAAGAFPAVKERPGCAKCWSVSTPGFGRPEDIDMVGELCEKHAGPHASARSATPPRMPTISIVKNGATNLKITCTGSCAYKSAEDLVGSARLNC